MTEQVPSEASEPDAAVTRRIDKRAMSRFRLAGPAEENAMMRAILDVCGPIFDHTSENLADLGAELGWPDLGRVVAAIYSLQASGRLRCIERKRTDRPRRWRVRGY